MWRDSRSRDFLVRESRSRLSLALIYISSLVPVSVSADFQNVVSSRLVSLWRDRIFTYKIRNTWKPHLVFFYYIYKEEFIQKMPPVGFENPVNFLLPNHQRHYGLIQKLRFSIEFLGHLDTRNYGLGLVIFETRLSVSDSIARIGFWKVSDSSRLRDYQSWIPGLGLGWKILVSSHSEPNQEKIWGKGAQPGLKRDQ